MFSYLKSKLGWSENFKRKEHVHKDSKFLIIFPKKMNTAAVEATAAAYAMYRLLGPEAGSEHSLYL